MPVGHDMLLTGSDEHDPGGRGHNPPRARVWPELSLELCLTDELWSARRCHPEPHPGKPVPVHWQGGLRPQRFHRQPGERHASPRPLEITTPAYLTPLPPWVSPSTPNPVKPSSPLRGYSLCLDLPAQPRTCLLSPRTKPMTFPHTNSKPAASRGKRCARFLSQSALNSARLSSSR